MTIEERIAMVKTIERMSDLLAALYKHPDLPQHGMTRPIILEIVNCLKLMAEITRMTDKQVVITGNGTNVDRCIPRS